MTTMIDKFNCITDNKRYTKTLLDILDNYFENYFQNNNKVLLYEYFSQINHYNSEIINSDELYKIIYNQLENYIIVIRNNMRISIKKDLFNLDSGLNKFFIDFHTKLKFINNFINNNNLCSLLDIIINDIYIKNYIEQNITNSGSIIKIYNSLHKLDSRIKLIFIKIIGDIYIKMLTQKIDYPLPENLKRLYNFKNILIKSQKIINKYNNSPQLKYNLTTNYLYDLITNELTEIIKNNSLCEISGLIKENLIINHYIVSDIPILLLLNKIDTEIIITDTYINDISNILNFIKYSRNYQVTLKIKAQYNNFINRLANIPNFINKLFDVLNSDMTIKLFDILGYNTSNNSRASQYIRLAEILENYENKDEMIKLYYKNLLKRLLYNFNKITNLRIFTHYLKLEKDMIYPFYAKLSTLLYPIKKLLDDIVKSYNLKYELIESKMLSSLINTPIISNNDEINTREGIIHSDIINYFDTELTNQLKIIQNQYSKLHNNTKSISWVAHFGEVNITYLDKKVKLLPIHMLILEMFNDTDFKMHTDLFSAPILQNYSADFKSQIIQSFVNGKLLLRINNTYILNNAPTFSNDFISIFHSLSDMKQRWEEQKEIEIIHSRQDITMANINNILKSNKYNYQDLYTKLKDNIKLFILDEKIVNESLDIMIKKDYIQKTNDVYEKIYY
jgi:hypothetical protein